MKTFFKSRFCFYLVSAYACWAIIALSIGRVEGFFWMIAAIGVLLSLTHFLPWLEGYVKKKTDFRHIVPAWKANEAIEKLWQASITVHQSNIIFYEDLMARLDSTDKSQMILGTFLIDLRDKEFKNQINAQFSLGQHLENQK